MSAVSRVSLLEVTGPLAVWRGEELARQPGRVIASGHAALDAQLPGGGWPLDGMVELLQPHVDSSFWQLVLPALAQAAVDGPGPVVLVAPPHAPFMPCLAAQGLPADRLLCLRAGKPGARLWATEQALRCAEVTAVLAWLPQARDAELRRLQLAAQEQSRLLFVFRDAGAREAGSPARLRLWLEEKAGAIDVHILKRRGPPLHRPVPLPARAAAVDALLSARVRHVPSRPKLSVTPAVTSAVMALRSVATGPRASPPLLQESREESHALDRTAAA